MSLRALKRHRACQLKSLKGPRLKQGICREERKRIVSFPKYGIFRKCKLEKMEMWLDLRKRWESLTKETDLNWHEISWSLRCRLTLPHLPHVWQEDCPRPPRTCRHLQTRPEVSFYPVRRLEGRLLGTASILHHWTKTEKVYPPRTGRFPAYKIKSSIIDWFLTARSTQQCTQKHQLNCFFFV